MRREVFVLTSLLFVIASLLFTVGLGLVGVPLVDLTDALVTGTPLLVLGTVLLGCLGTMFASVREARAVKGRGAPTRSARVENGSLGT